VNAVIRNDDCVSAGAPAERGCPPAAVDGVDQATLRGKMVNYLRHARTIYDAALIDLYARVGLDAATEAIRDRVYAAIVDTYQALADEACRPAAERQAGL